MKTWQEEFDDRFVRFGEYYYDYNSHRLLIDPKEIIKFFSKLLEKEKKESYEKGIQDAALQKVDELDVPYFMKAYESVIRKQLLDELLADLKHTSVSPDDYDQFYSIILSKY